MWDERTYRLLLFADALFNAGRLHHDARQTLLQEENSTDVQLMTFYIKLKICKLALSGCRADFKMLSASCSVSFQSSSTWRSENKYKLVGFSKPGHYAVWECWLSAARELHSKTETACRENSLSKIVKRWRTLQAQHPTALPSPAASHHTKPGYPTGPVGHLWQYIRTVWQLLIISSINQHIRKEKGQIFILLQWLAVKMLIRAAECNKNICSSDHSDR